MTMRALLAAVAVAAVSWTAPVFAQSRPAPPDAGAAPLRQLAIPTSPRRATSTGCWSAGSFGSTSPTAAQVLPKVTVRADVVLRPAAKTGWAIRKHSPKLAAEIDDFYRNWAIKQGVVAYRMNQYMTPAMPMRLRGPTGWRARSETSTGWSRNGR